MIRLPPRSTRTGTLLPCTTLFRSGALVRLIAMSGLLASDGRAHRGLAGDRGTGGARGPHPAGRSARGGWRGLQFFGLREEARVGVPTRPRSEEHTSELQSLMRISYAVFCLKKKNQHMRQVNRPDNTETE